MGKTVKPYENTTGKKEQVSTMFDNIAKWYDFLNHLLSMGIDKRWRKKAIEKLKSHNPKTILDVATGTGDIAIEIAKKLNPDKITGIDISEEMLEIGRKKITKKGFAEIIELKTGDSENIQYPDNHFDAVTVAFGVRNFENLEKGLREMYRVLNANGKLVILEFSKPHVFPFKQLYLFYFKNILPAIGKILSKDPKAYEYLFQSVQAFPNGKDFEEILLKLGFRETESQPLTFGICTLYTAQK